MKNTISQKGNQTMKRYLERKPEKNFTRVTMEKNFEHHCSCCQFLGSTKDPQNNNYTCDLYICRPTKGSHITVLARYSDTISDYQSGLNSAFEHGSFILWVASQRAIKLGYLTLTEWEKATRFGRGL